VEELPFLEDVKIELNLFFTTIANIFPLCNFVVNSILAYEALLEISHNTYIAYLLFPLLSLPGLALDAFSAGFDFFVAQNTLENSFLFRLQFIIAVFTLITSAIF